ncbi:MULTISPECIES: phosphonate metabolism transcriptional regulator PhnF [Paracoccus]|uniref:Phosphonate metabolism transcriptional regulator PhnF n=1 Tax=Paracoccus litorisediminis TaxID=2006130 RepID=A0A844HT14_9RHOB|nr:MULTISPECIES: phosphonate metabolism transcriptional regulator PhnF [Paracoccus]MBD9529636.1 phosphonate metabolism transcriptional regulator PhnF [Paracoccus sp. PAR01]MTH62238.1 phosphonate metabolism transcriptional regulator PhnF [Paracoccus litorisediminis]
MSRTAIWAEIAQQLSTEIASGQRRPGDKLPTEAELSARFGVNRHTVRRALADMADRGMVHSRRGAGVFVQGLAVDYPLGLRTRFSTNLAAMGRAAGRTLLNIETRHASAPEAAALQLDPEARVHVLDGISTADGLAVAFFRSIFPASRFPGLPETLRREMSITRALAEHGITDYTRAETRLTAERADTVVALHLRLREGDPILRAVGINIDPQGAPVEYGHTWFAGDRVTLTVTPEG